MSFATDTAVTQIGPGRFTAELHERWSSLVGIHGGYTAAIVANAMTTAVDDPSRPSQLRHPVRLHPRPRSGGHRGDRRTHRQVDDHHQRPPAAGGKGAAGRPRRELDDPARPRLRRPRPPATPTPATPHGSRPPTASGTSRTPTSGSTRKRSSSAADTKRTSRRGCGHSRANRSTRHGWSPCATSSLLRSSAAPPALSRRRRSSTSCIWPPPDPPCRPGSTATSRVDHRSRPKASPSRMPRCGHRTDVSSRSPVRLASPGPDRSATSRADVTDFAPLRCSGSGSCRCRRPRSRPPGRAAGTPAAGGRRRCRRVCR